MIRRAPHTHDYTIISNHAANDERLSFQAKGMLYYLMSKPDHWQISREHLATVCPNGISSVRAILAELEKCGYITRERKCGKNGRFEWDCIVHESPIATSSPSADFPPMVYPPMVKPPVVNRTLVNTKEVKTERVKTKQTNGAQAQAPKAVPVTEADPFDPTGGAPVKPRSSSSFDLDAVLEEAPNWAEELERIVAQKGSIANPRGYKAAIVRGWLQHPDDASTPPKKKPTPQLPPPPPPMPREVLNALGWDEETCRLYMSQAIGQLKQQGAFKEYDPTQHRAMAIEQARALRACVRGTTGTGQGNGHGQGGRMYQ